MPRQPGAKALVTHDGKLLLIQRDNKPEIPQPNKWNAPGGGIDPDEAPRDALIRELKEEIDVSPARIFDLGTTTYPDGSLVYRYHCPLSAEEASRVHLVSEGQAIGWFTLDETLALDLSHYLRSYLVAIRSDIELMLRGEYEAEPRDIVLSLE